VHSRRERSPSIDCHCSDSRFYVWVPLNGAAAQGGGLALALGAHQHTAMIRATSSSRMLTRSALVCLLPPPDDITPLNTITASRHAKTVASTYGCTPPAA
jgi:hypothetical protein